MSNNLNIHFDYGGSYLKTIKEDIWNSGGHIYSLALKKSIEEITYSILREMIHKKIGVDESTVRLRLSYIPLLMKPMRSLIILDDEDVYVYLTSLDLQQCRSCLNVEVIKDLDVEQQNEQLSRVGHENSVGLNYCDLYSSDVVVNKGVITLDVDMVQEEEEEHDMREDDVIEETEEWVREEFEDVENNKGEKYVDLPCDSQDSQSIVEWEDGMSLEIGQKFGSTTIVQDLVDRAAFKNYFGYVVVKSDKTRLVLKCRQVACNWYLRIAQITNSKYFSVRRYINMHTCSRSTASTNNIRRNGTPRIAASVLHVDYPGKYETLAPKSLMGLVQGKLGVKVSSSTALRGKKLVVRDVRGNP